MGLSPDDVYKKIRIRASYLQAIENSEFEQLPDPVYTKNFIKIYAKFLGVDEEPVLKDYNDYIYKRKEAQMPPPETPPEEKHFFPSTANKKNYWGIIFVIIVVLVIWLILKQNQPVPEGINTPVAAVGSPNSTSPPAAAPTDSQATVSIPAPQAGLTADPSTPVAAKKSNLLITATQETWLRVKPDDNLPVQILLKSGEKFESDAEFFNLDIGNAGGIKIQYKGRYIENPGKPGEVIHIRLPQVKQ